MLSQKLSPQDEAQLVRNGSPSPVQRRIRLGSTRGIDTPPRLAFLNRIFWSCTIVALVLSLVTKPQGPAHSPDANAESDVGVVYCLSFSLSARSRRHDEDDGGADDQ